MNGPDLLKHAAGVVDKRRSEYGGPEDRFANIAQRWSQVLGIKVTPVQAPHPSRLRRGGFFVA